MSCLVFTFGIFEPIIKDPIVVKKMKESRQKTEKNLPCVLVHYSIAT